MTYGSHQKVWWRCPQGHSYRSEVRIRARGTGCPVCAGRIVLPEENSLAAKFPDLLSEWDTEKNSPLLPTQVMPGAHRKVWWRCPKGHSWQASVASRVTSNAGCPFCAGQKVLPGFNDLASLHPQLAEQWDWKKNGALTPEAVSAYSNRRVWWLCDKGHSFCAVIAHRVNRESDCPYCTNRKVLPGFNDLETKEPVIASQWHPTFNGCFTPQQVTPGSSRKAIQTEQSARPPNLGAAMDVVRRRLGDSKANSLAMRSDVYSPCQPETFSNDSGSHNYPKNLIGGKL